MLTRAKIIAIFPCITPKGNIWDYILILELSNGQLIEIFYWGIFNTNFDLNLEYNMEIVSTEINKEINFNSHNFRVVKIEVIDQITLFSNDFICISVLNKDIESNNIIENKVYTFGRLDIVNIY